MKKMLKKLRVSFDKWFKKSPRMAIVCITIMSVVIGCMSYEGTRLFVQHRIAVRDAYCRAQPLNCTFIRGSIHGKRNSFRTDHDDDRK